MRGQSPEGCRQDGVYPEDERRVREKAEGDEGDKAQEVQISEQLWGISGKEGVECETVGSVKQNDQNGLLFFCYLQDLPRVPYPILP